MLFSCTAKLEQSVADQQQIKQTGYILMHYKQHSPLGRGSLSHHSMVSAGTLITLDVTWLDPPYFLTRLRFSMTYATDIDNSHSRTRNSEHNRFLPWASVAPTTWVEMSCHQGLMMSQGAVVTIIATPMTR
jgi:hypothetical protein